MKWSMGRFLVQVKSILGSHRGVAVIIIALLFFVCLIVMGMYIVEDKYLRLGHSVVDDAVVGAGLAALASSIETEIAYGEYALDKAEAERVFMAHLQRSLGLNDALHPGPNSIITGPIKIESLIIYNPEEISHGLQCPLGTPVETTAIHVVLSFDLKRPALKGIFGDTVEVRIHRDVDNYYTLSNF